MLNQVSGKSIVDMILFSVILAADILLPFIKPFTALFNWEVLQPGFGTLQILIALGCIGQIWWSIKNYNELG